MKKEYFLLFIVLFFLCLSNLANLCGIYSPLTYDNQIWLAWNYAASIGLFPYKDIFYPYGLISYYKGHNAIFSTIYILLAPFLLTFLFAAIAKVFKNRLFSYFSLLILFLFILRFTGFEVFTRFGVLVVISSFFAYLLYSYKDNLSRWKILFAGVLNGIMLPFFNDQGIFAIAVFIALLITDKLLRNNFKRVATCKALLLDACIFLFGVFIGMGPFFIVLILHQSFFQFFTSLLELSDLTQFSKTPFFHAFASVDNIFTFAVLVLTISFLAYKLIYVKSKATFNNYIQIGIVFALIVLEQKNITRSADTQLTFIGVLLFIFLFYEVKNFLQEKKVSQVKIFFVYLTLSISILLSIDFHPAFSRNATKLCLKNETKLYSANIKTYELVKQEVEKMPGFNGKIFSFPGDTVFYVVFKQRMPYYPTIYEASSRDAQEKMIRHIEDNKINHIIFNSENYAIQDEVPNYVRSSRLYSYILNNYSIKKKVDNFLVLQKNSKEEDLFKDKEFISLTELRKYLLQVNMENIPRSEGLYKSKHVYDKNNKLLLSTKSLKTVNNYFKNKKVDSNHAFLVVEFQNGSKKRKITLNLKTEDNLETKIMFSQCEGDKPCIMHLSRIPVFYKNRQIESLSADSNGQIKNIAVFQIADDSHFW